MRLSVVVVVVAAVTRGRSERVWTRFEVRGSREGEEDGLLVLALRTILKTMRAQLCKRTVCRTLGAMGRPQRGETIVVMRTIP